MKSNSTIESAYREGYGAGYENGSNDHAAYEQGCGNKHRNAQKRDENDAWRDSEAQAAKAKASDAEEYAHEWTITIKADNLHGAMDAAWNCWEAWRDGNEPRGGCCPASMGDRMTYDVTKTKQPPPKIESIIDKEKCVTGMYD